MSGAIVRQETDLDTLAHEDPPGSRGIHRESVKRKRLDLSCVYCQRLFAKPEHLKVRCRSDQAVPRL